MSRVTFRLPPKVLGKDGAGMRGSGYGGSAHQYLGTALEDLPTWQDALDNERDGVSFGSRAGPSGSGKWAAADVDIDFSQPSKFPVNVPVNRKMRFWEGDNWLVQVDAIVTSTTIHMEPTEDYQGLYALAGPGLVEECGPLGGCRTGEAKITQAHGLPAAHVIHTVGPRYATRYRTAAENALCHAYRACMEVLVENNLRSIAVGCVHLKAKGYPRGEAAHVALRTLRRFLEKFHARVDAVVVAVTGGDYAAFAECMPLYFPRNQAEEDAARSLLPEHTGNESGEVMLEERDIRITAIPAHRQPPAERIGGAPSPTMVERAERLAGEGPRAHGPQSLMSDPDLQAWGANSGGGGGGGGDGGRRHAGAGGGGGGDGARASSSAAAHAEYLAKARRLDVTDIGSYKVLFKCGVDFEKRPVVVMVGAHLDPIARCNELERFLVYAVKELQPVMSATYSMVYFHAEANSTGALELGFLRQLHAALGPQHKDNLKVLYVVHPTLALRCTTSALATLGAGLSKRVWRKAVYVDRLQSLFQYIPASQLHVPDFVADHDRRLD